MDTEGCWNCRSLLHHRRDCDVHVSKEEADKTKSELRLAFKQSKHKTAKEVAEWNRKLLVRSEPPLPRRFLRSHLEDCLQDLQNVEYELYDIGSPDGNNIEAQLDRAFKLKEEFVAKMSIMREVVSSCKNYVKSLQSFDDEDLHFKSSLEDLDLKRQPLYCRVCRIVADLAEVKRRENIIQTMAEVVRCEVAECDVVVGGERSPAESEALLIKMRDITPVLTDLQRELSKVHLICPNYKFELAETLQRQFDELWLRRNCGEKRALQNMKSKLECPVCLETYSVNRPCFVVTCGHQFCEPCLIGLRNNGNSCAICRKDIGNSIRMY